MVRPRWHDAVIISAIAALFVVGLCALWWEDVRDLLHFGPGSGSAPTEPAPPPNNQT